MLKDLVEDDPVKISPSPLASENYSPWTIVTYGVVCVIIFA